MAPLRHDPGDGRVEAVVVAGREVDHHVVEGCRGCGGNRGPPGAVALGEGKVGADGGFGGGAGCGALVGGGCAGVDGAVVVPACGVGFLRAGEEVGERVGDAVYLRKLLVVAYGFAAVGSTRALAAWLWRVWRAGHVTGGCVFGRGMLVVVVMVRRGAFGAEQRVQAVRDAFYLLDLSVFDGAELDDAAVGGGEEGVWVWVERPDAGLKGAVEEGGEVGVGVEVGVFHFGETKEIPCQRRAKRIGRRVLLDAENPGVELETRNAEVIGDLQLIEPTPNA